MASNYNHATLRRYQYQKYNHAPVAMHQGVLCRSVYHQGKPQAGILKIQG